MKKVRLKMKINNNGLLLDTDKDLALCGMMNCDEEMTLYKTTEGQFYTHIVTRDECDDKVDEEIELNTKEEAADILFFMGFKRETIKHETGINIVGEVDNETGKKIMYN